MSLQVRHLTFICRRFQKNNIGPFAHQTSSAANTASINEIDEKELLLLVNLMVALGNVVSLRVEVKGIENADEGDQRESLASIPSTVCPMDLFPSLSKVLVRLHRYFNLNMNTKIVFYITFKEKIPVEMAGQ